MKYDSPLEEGRFLKRYKRFFADIHWQNQTITAHVPNTGSLKSCSEPNSLCLFSISKNPDRKLPYTLEMIQSQSGHWVGVNTTNPNKLIKEALQNQHFKWWSGFDEIKPEFKISKESRLDFALIRKNSDMRHYIEVKNVTLAENGHAKFPDSVTERGQKHLRDLMNLQSAGHTVEIVFAIQREDVEAFSPADDIDCKYGQLLREAVKQGVRVTPVVISMQRHQLIVSERILPLKLG